MITEWWTAAYLLQENFDHNAIDKKVCIICFATQLFCDKIKTLKPQKYFPFLKKLCILVCMRLLKKIWSSEI